MAGEFPDIVEIADRKAAAVFPARERFVKEPLR